MCVWHVVVFECGVELCGSTWALLTMQGEEMGDCRRHVPPYLQVGASDGAQVGRRESFAPPHSIPTVALCNHDRDVQRGKNIHPNFHHL